MRTSLILATLLPAIYGLTITQRDSVPPDCVFNCIASAATSTSCASSDTSCLCTSPLFISNVAVCLTKNCSPADAATGVLTGQAFCASIGANVTIPAGVASSLASSAAAVAPPTTVIITSSAKNSAAASTTAAPTPASVTPAAVVAKSNGAALAQSLATILAFFGAVVFSV